jgi:hypothetical protein
MRENLDIDTFPFETFSPFLGIGLGQVKFIIYFLSKEILSYSPYKPIELLSYLYDSSGNK